MDEEEKPNPTDPTDPTSPARPSGRARPASNNCVKS